MLRLFQTLPPDESAAFFAAAAPAIASRKGPAGTVVKNFGATNSERAG